MVDAGGRIVCWSLVWKGVAIVGSLVDFALAFPESGSAGSSWNPETYLAP